jgi:hypothetical protein
MHRRGLRPKNHPPPYAPPKDTPEDTYVCYGCGIQKTERHFQELGVKHPDSKNVALLAEAVLSWMKYVTILTKLH